MCGRWLTVTERYLSPAGTAARFVALYTYESSEPGDLVFQQGDVIHVTERHGEWWTGSLAGGTSGIFPSNYVQPMEVGGWRRADSSISAG